MPDNTDTLADPPSPVATEPPSDDHHPVTGLCNDNYQSSLRLDWLSSKPGCYIDGSVPEVPVKYFTQHLIPPLPDDLSVRTVAAKLDLNDLNNIPTLEEDIFVPDRFIAFAGAVQDAGLELLKEENVERASLAVFAENPVAREEWSRKDGDCHMAHPRKPGSYAVLKDKYESGQSEAPGWQDIAVLGVTVYNDRNHQVELQEAYTRIVTAMFEAMRETPHRRFVYGYTIDYQSESMRLWFLSRSDLLVSRPFNFVHHQLPVLVHFFLSIQFASLAQLGYDPTMKLFRSPVSTSINRGKDHYDITVHWNDQSSQRKESVFRTVELLSDVGAKTALSTGTREWVALELGADGKPFGEPVTIRDYWVKDEHPREGNILANIRRAAIESGDAEHIQNVENHLAHVVCKGDVYVGDKRDNTVSLHRRGSLLPDDRRTLALACAEETHGHCSIKLDLEATESQGLTHYRIVYKHFGKTIDTVLRMSKLLKLLPQALNGMSTIHALGHVHRGISPSNISIVGSRAIITGFELAESMGKSLERERKPVGAEQFMAVEVAHQRYLFLPGQTETRDETPRPPKPARTLTPPRSPMHFSFPAGYFDDSLNADGSIGLDDECNKPKAEPAPSHLPTIPPQPPQPESPPFKFNALHDCESFWWTCVYLLIHRKACASSMSGASMLNVFAPGQQLITAWASVFGGQTTEISHEDRQSLLEDKGRFKELCTHVCSGIEITAENLEEARKSLVQTFTDAEKDVKTIDRAVGKKLYGVFKEALSTALERVARLEAKKRRPIVFEDLNVVRVMNPSGTTDYDTKDTRPGPLEARIEMIRLDKPFAELEWQPQKEEEDEAGFDSLLEREPTASPSSSVASLSGSGKRKREDSYDSLPPPSQWKRSRWVDYEDAPQSTPDENLSQALDPIPEEVEAVKTQTSDVGEGSTTGLGGTPMLPSATQGGRRTRRSREQRWGSTRSHSMGLRSSQN